MMTVKKYCEEKNLDPNKVFDMVWERAAAFCLKLSDLQDT